MKVVFYGGQNFTKKEVPNLTMGICRADKCSNLVLPCSIVSLPAKYKPLWLTANRARHSYKPEVECSGEEASTSHKVSEHFFSQRHVLVWPVTAVMSNLHNYSNCQLCPSNCWTY